MAEIICETYGTKKKFDSVVKAKEFFLQCIECSEGSEQQRYMNIYLQLSEGCTYCSDRF